MSDDLELSFVQALEPLVLELEGLRRALAESQAELATVRARVDDRAELEGLVQGRAQDRAALERAQAELAELREDLTARQAELERVRGELAHVRRRLEAPAWAPGVYRAGAVVEHFHGQHFEAIADTAAEPGDGATWKRLGLGGFRPAGLRVAGATYAHGDLVQENGGTWLQHGAELVWLALGGKAGPRGAPGEGLPGPPGRDGAPGARGADGAMVVKLEANAGVLWCVMSDGRREPIALESVALEGTSDG